VKITAVAPALPFLPKSEDSIPIDPSPEKCISRDDAPPESVAPDTCNSNGVGNLNNTKNKPTMVVQKSVTLDPIDSSLFPVKEENLPALLTDEENEDEFGEFLLDAVQWL